MSTRSIIAVQYGDGFRGRYCHSDGYPMHNGRVLFEEVRSAGVDALEAFLDDDGRGAWGISYISSGFLVAPNEQTWDGGDNGGNHAVFSQASYSHRVYRDRPNEMPTPWITHADTDLWGTEWCYVASKGGLSVGVVRYTKDMPETVKWLGFYGWHQTPDWSALQASGYGEVLA